MSFMVNRAWMKGYFKLLVESYDLGFWFSGDTEGKVWVEENWEVLERQLFIYPFILRAGEGRDGGRGEKRGCSMQKHDLEM
jgi:hypothetical protein